MPGDGDLKSRPRKWSLYAVGKSSYSADPFMLNAVRAWIVFSAALCSAGWLLSLVHRLDKLGYATVFAALAFAGVWWSRFSFKKLSWEDRWRRMTARRRRFRRWLPLAFVVLAVAATVGGILHAPIHADALQYRTPRVLNWLTAGQWHWIYAWDLRLNVISCGYEFLTAPFLLFTESDHVAVFINVLSFFMLPGLVFGVFVQLGVRSRVAWNWMWIFPCGWVYCMQAGGLGNDQFATVYSLASVYFALRARKTGRVTDLWISILACALVTGTKQTNVPLALLWFIAAWPSLRLLWQRPLLTVLVGAIALFASGVPIAWLDLVHTGTWTGWPKEKSLQPSSPLVGIVGNGVVLIAYNFMPPIFPFARQWNEARLRFLESSMGQPFNSFEMFANMPRAAAEQSAGLGLFVSGLVILAFLAGLRNGRLGPSPAQSWLSPTRLLRGASWCLLLLFMAKVGSWNAPRYLAAYYPFLFPTFLLGTGQNRVVRSRWWKGLSMAAMVLTILLIVFSRQRPVWPALFVTTKLKEQFPNSTFVSKFAATYDFSRGIRNLLDEPFLSKIPPEEKVIGYATTMGGLDRVLWFPLGSRRIAYVKPDDTAESIRSRGFNYLMVDSGALEKVNLKIENWLARCDAEIVAAIHRDFGSDFPKLDCYLLRLRPAPK
jgi:hypothetical protein